MKHYDHVAAGDTLHLVEKGVEPSKYALGPTALCGRPTGPSTRAMRGKPAKVTKRCATCFGRRTLEATGDACDAS